MAMEKTNTDQTTKLTKHHKRVRAHHTVVTYIYRTVQQYTYVVCRTPLGGTMAGRLTLRPNLYHDSAVHRRWFDKLPIHSHPCSRLVPLTNPVPPPAAANRLKFYSGGGRTGTEPSATLPGGFLLHGSSEQLTRSF